MRVSLYPPDLDLSSLSLSLSLSLLCVHLCVLLDFSSLSLSIMCVYFCVLLIYISHVRVFVSSSSLSFSLRHIRACVHTHTHTQCHPHAYHTHTHTNTLSHTHTHTHKHTHLRASVWRRYNTCWITLGNDMRRNAGNGCSKCCHHFGKDAQCLQFAWEKELTLPTNGPVTFLYLVNRFNLSIHVKAQSHCTKEWIPNGKRTKIGVCGVRLSLVLPVRWSFGFRTACSYFSRLRQICSV